jgi:hypothetical protein
VQWVEDVLVGLAPVDATVPATFPSHPAVSAGELIGTAHSQTVPTWMDTNSRHPAQPSALNHTMPPVHVL